ncbi:hypothetical protein [Streptomyces sp. NPDC007094]|uniref:hypothetical protein n=1 Tax=Streptomyces sp. NPDC007094 TaxID=3155359 RepID=UPI0033FF8357
MADRWRSPTGVAEDRNTDIETRETWPGLWRSPTGAAEDRNGLTPGELLSGYGGGRPPG